MAEGEGVIHHRGTEPTEEFLQETHSREVLCDLGVSVVEMKG
jgi:hypothetical protein